MPDHLCGPAPGQVKNAPGHRRRGDTHRLGLQGLIGPVDQFGLATLRLQFADAAGSIKPYTSSGDIAVRLHRSDWSAYDQSVNFSYRSNTNLADWDHVTLYRAGALVWGSEPPSPSPSPSPSGR